MTRENWKPGDLAECIHPGPWFRHGVLPGTGPQYTEIGMVKFVGAARDLLTGKLVPVLRFERYGASLFPGSMFLKVLPRREAANGTGIVAGLDREASARAIAAATPEHL